MEKKPGEPVKEIMTVEAVEGEQCAPGEEVRQTVSTPPGGRKSVFIAQPSYNGQCSQQIIRSVVEAITSGHRVAFVPGGGSILTHTFNKLWASFLTAASKEKAFDYFVMIHDDIMIKKTLTPDMGNGNWLQCMLNIMEHSELDVLSAFVPIKDYRGLSSTAMDTSFWAPRRITMHEALNKLPITFETPHCVEALSGTGPVGDLLLNSGLMVIKYGEWCHDTWFEFRNDISQDDEGNFCARVSSEDWLFSRLCHQKLRRIACTRAVVVEHVGHQAFPNNAVWGTMKVDEHSGVPAQEVDNVPDGEALGKAANSVRDHAPKKGPMMVVEV